VFENNELRVFSDSDWAGCRATRKSTSGGLIQLDGVALKAWSSTQATVATSSGEAELHAAVKAASEGLGFQSLAKDLGVELAVEVVVDSSAAKSIMSCDGLGKTKHIEVKSLWVQEAVGSGRISVAWVPGDRNPADVLTKPHSFESFKLRLQSVGFHIRSRGNLNVIGACRSSRCRWADFEVEDTEVFDHFEFCF
jgi:hypothetical protein